MQECLDVVPEAVRVLLLEPTIRSLAHSVCAMGAAGGDMEQAIANVRLVLIELVSRLLASRGVHVSAEREPCHRDLAEAFLATEGDGDGPVALAMTRCLQHLGAADRLHGTAGNRPEDLTSIARALLKQTRWLHDAVGIIEQSCRHVLEFRSSHSVAILDFPTRARHGASGLVCSLET